MTFDLLPGLHARLDLNHLVRHVDHSDGDLAGLGVALPFEVVIHSCFQIAPQLRLRKPCGKKKEKTNKVQVRVYVQKYLTKPDVQ